MYDTSKTTPTNPPPVQEQCDKCGAPVDAFGHYLKDAIVRVEGGPVQPLKRRLDEPDIKKVPKRHRCRTCKRMPESCNCRGR